MAVNIKSSITLYYLDNLPEDNYALDKGAYDDIDLCLQDICDGDDETYTFSNFQLQRIEKENIFVLPLNEDYAINLTNKNYNYATVTQIITQEDQTSESQIIPYKIKKIIWNGTESVKIYATLDVATYFVNSDLDFTYECIIDRAHVDRFEGTRYLAGINYLIPRIDYHEEPIDTPIKYLSSNESVRSIVQDTSRWNLVYYSDPNTANAIRTLIIPDTQAQGVTVRVANTSIITINADTYYIIRGVDNSGTTITFKNTSFTFGSTGNLYEEVHIYNDGGTYKFYALGFNISSVGNNWNGYTSTIISQDNSSIINYFSYDNDIVYYTNPSNQTQTMFSTSNIPFTPKSQHTAYLNTTTTSAVLTGLNDIPLTNPRLIKIIACPFCPADLSSSNCLYRNITDDYMNIDCVEWISNADLPLTTLYSTTTGLIDLIRAPASFDLISGNIDYETKLLNSNYTEFDIEYGAYKLNIPLEMYNFNATNIRFNYSLKYKQAKLKSDLLFKYEANNTIKDNFEGLLNAESNYLVSDIDNEKPIFTSEYLNYIKNGYNYDKNNMNRQTVVSSALAATSILGGIAGVAAGAFTGGVSAAAGIGLITSGVSSAINIINNRIASEASIQRKLASYKNSSTGVAGVNALDLRKEYQAYDLYLRSYTISNDVKYQLFYLFNLYGYQLNITDENIKSYYNTRRYWNYIKASKVVYEPLSKAIYQKHSDLLEEYTRLLNEGLTIYHPLDDGGDVKYDFEHTYENFETSLT